MRKLPSESLISYRTAIICTTAFLTCLGLLALYASSSIPAAEATGDPLYYFYKQAIVATLGFTLIFAAGHLGFRWIEILTLPAICLTLLLLALVYTPFFEGRAGGASRWFMIFGVSIQPGELAKLALILFLARNLARPKCNLENFWTGLLPNILVFLLLAALLLGQPDFGSTVMLSLVLATMLYVAGLPRRYMFWGMAASLAGLASAIALSPYRMRRLLTFLDPWSEARGSGFQIIQSYLGFQNGGFWGVGLGESRQKLFFLPEAHTDFILAVIGEELGLVGVLLVCLLFGYLVYLGAVVTLQQKLAHRRFLALGITTLIASQACLNMGVTMGVLPTKGMTLPFVSHGANSLIVFLTAIAILARISQEAPHQPGTRYAQDL